MKGFWRYFWLLYILFFAIPFPMLLYYNAEDKSTSATAPWLALTWLALSVLLWIALLRGWFRKWILNVFIMKNNIRRLAQTGTRAVARVVESKTLTRRRKDIVAMQMKVTLQNFSGTEISEELEINDSKPELRRYDKGKTIHLLIDRTLKSVPYLSVEDTTVTVKVARLAAQILGWVVILVAVLWYYDYAYTHENNGTGWRFLKFYHPLVLCPLILLVTRVGLRKLLDVLGGSPSELLKLKYFGLRTDAAIVSATQTGTYINEQPQVKFELSYQDYSGRVHTATLKKIVSLLDLGVAQQKTVPVFYLKLSPGVVAFASDIED